LLTRFQSKVAVSNHSNCLDCFQSKFQRRCRNRKNAIALRQPCSLPSQIAAASWLQLNLFTWRTRFMIVLQVLNLRFARLSVCQLSPVTMQDAHNRSRVQLADELPKDVFPHLSPQIAAHGFRRMTAISQSCFRNFELLTSQGALTP
jgi:hypothetical protein